MKSASQLLPGDCLARAQTHLINWHAKRITAVAQYERSAMAALSGVVFQLLTNVYEDEHTEALLAA